MNGNDFVIASSSPGGELGSCSSGELGVCITCGDIADPMTVLRVDEVRGLALCEAAGGEHSTVETALVDPVAPGDVLLVHAGTALTRLEEARA